MFFVERDHMIEDFHGDKIPPIARQLRFAKVPVRSSAWLSNPSPSKRRSHRRRVSNRDRRWRNDTDQPRGRLHATAAPPTRLSGVASTLKCRIFRRPCSMTKKQYNSLNVTDG